MGDNSKSGTSWWQTVPGALTAAAGIITALTGLVVALHQIGLFNPSVEPAAAPSATAHPPASSAVSATPAAGDKEKEYASARSTAGQSSSQAPAAPAGGGLNLLAVDNGGQLLLAPNDEWTATIDGKEDAYRAVRVAEEAVFAFKDEQPATFDTFGMLIPKSGRNPREFQLFAADESANGPFRPIASFQPQNVKLMKTGGWQDFKFPPVTAEYLKVKLKSSYEDSVWLDLYEFRVLGQLRDK